MGEGKERGEGRRRKKKEKMRILRGDGSQHQSY